MSRLILAHDLGTSGDKATLFSEEGELVGSTSYEYPTDYSEGGFAEQNPDHWWEAVCLTTRKLMEGRDQSKVAAIAFSGQMMGCLCVDSAGRPLRKHILYSDQRSVPQEKAYAAKAGWDEVYHITGHRCSASYGATKLMWVRDNQPDIYRRTYKMLNAKDYINFLMTGRMVAEPTDASSTNLYDLVKGDWSMALVEAAGLDGDKLPELVKSTTIVGELTKEAASAMGLRAGIPVVTGAGDGLCAAVGAGSVAPGKTYNYLGSSSWVATSSTEPVYDKDKRTFTWAHPVDGLFHPCGTMQTAAASYAWLRREVCHSEVEKAAAAGKSAYAFMDETAATSAPGSRGLIYLPYLLGERSPRWNPLARGGFIGLTMAHTRGDLVRSVMEGVSMNLSVIIEIFRARGVPIKDILVIGGGAKGAIWRQIMADVYEATILRPDHLEEATSIGAAIIAGVGIGIYKDFSVSEKFLKITERTHTKQENLPVYRKNKRLFDKLYQALEPTFPDFV